MNRAQKAYAAFHTITTDPYERSNTSKLSIIYTIVCRAEKDSEYKKELESFMVPDGSGMNLLEAIDTFFRSFNNSHGVDIRNTLTVLDNPDFPEGLYFIVKTYKKTENGLVEHSPVEFKVGEEAIFKAVLYNQVSDEETVAPIIKYYVYSEDGTEKEEEFKNVSSIEFSATCHRPGAVRAMITACDADGKKISGCETAAPGALFDFTEIKTTLPTPDDLEEFWRGQVDKLKKVLPTDTELTPYSGDVVFQYDVDKTNYYHVKKADKDYLAMIRSKRLTTVTDTILDDFDIWEFSLKCLGPCPATGYITIPKNAEPHSLPLHFIYAGYSAHAPNPFFNKNCIFVYSTHHGYPCGLSDEEYYTALNGNGILGSYGRGNGKPNSLFTNKYDCYNLYLILRNLQALRFVADPDLSKDIPEIARLWNGDAEFEGGSLGGYQTIAICATAIFLDEKINITQVRSTVPAFCNYAGSTDKRLPNDLTQWAKNAEYFDAAHLATLIKNPMNIDRNSFGDELCVSSSICMAYNNFKGPKEMHFLQNSTHGYRPKTQAQLWYTVKKAASSR